VRSGWPLRNKRAATGGDRSSARAYGNRLHDHVTSLVERVKTQCSRVTCVRRHSIPKGTGALRPLGLPATEDKRLQMAVARILDAIYAPDCLPSSDGYRRKSGARDAVRDLTRPRPCGPYNSVGEADITGCFGAPGKARRFQRVGFPPRQGESQPTGNRVLGSCR